jgi:adenosylmethionine-8-amino-7-oxononanoate aminotransferase
MAVCDPVNGMHRLFTDVLAKHVFAPEPPPGYSEEADPGYLATLETIADEHSGELAGIIVEPIVQGAAGMRFYAPGYLAALRRIADEHGILLILDEIATGFGRTGTFWGHEHAGVVPDIMSVGKALTGGYLTMAATLCTDQVAHTITAGDGGALMHGPTYMANPLAAAVSSASIELLLSRDWAAEVRSISGGLSAGLEEARGLPGVADVRVLGAIGVIQTTGPVDVPAVQKIVMEHGVWLRPFRDLIYAMPPYVCTPADIEQITTAMCAAVRAL